MRLMKIEKPEPFTFKLPENVLAELIKYFPPHLNQYTRPYLLEEGYVKYIKAGKDFTATVEDDIEAISSDAIIKVEGLERAHPKAHQLVADILKRQGRSSIFSGNDEFIAPDFTIHYFKGNENCYSFNMHTDPVYVYMVQLTGSKLVRYEFKGIEQSVQLDAGTCLCLAPNVPHQVIHLEDNSMLSIGFIPWLWNFRCINELFI